MPSCYLFAGGGTGGHLTPGLAVAAELQQHDPDCRIVFAGTDRPLERKLIAGAGYQHVTLSVESSQTLLRHPFRFAWSNWRAILTARQLIEQKKPQGVIGLGGFASVPTVLVATRRRVPTIILEQNAIPGRATRLLSRRAGAVCATFDGTEQRLRSGAHVIVTGNPVRQAIAALCHRNPGVGSNGPPTLLVLGGSQGAESLNDAVVSMLTRDLPQLVDWRVVHQTGPSQHAETSRRYDAAKRNCIVAPFFDDMADLYASATLVVSRAGATTLAELACAGCPAILLPYPHAADNHQLANARVFERAGAAIVIEHDSDPGATANHLQQAVTALAADASRRAAMRHSLQHLAHPAAANQVVEVLQSLIAGTIR